MLRDAALALVEIAVIALFLGTLWMWWQFLFGILGG